MKLTKTMHRHLTVLEQEGRRSAYPGLSLKTLWALHGKGLAEPHAKPGSSAFPRTSLDWSITPAGRAALSQMEKNDDR